MQHDRRHHAAAPPAPAQRGDPLVAVRPGTPGRRPGGRGAGGGLHPGVGFTAARPALVQELGDLRELVHRVGLVLGELLLPSARSPAFTSTRSLPWSRSHTERAAKLPPSASHAPIAAACQDSCGV